MSLGLLNLQFDRNWWQGQRLRLALGLPLLVLYVYFAMPALVFPQAFTLLLLPLIPNAAYSLLGAARTFAISRRIVSIRRAPILPYVYALGALGVLAAVLAAMPFVDAGGLRDLADVTVSTSLPPSADLRHVRIVPQEAAVFAGNKVVGQLGAYYAVGDFNVQVAGGKLVWVAPLEFHGVVQWLARRTSPGVIVVSAEDPDASPELRARAPLRYIPSALLNDNLYRHVYLRYGTQRILETTLQLDDTGAPQYICTLGRPTIGYTGDAVTGVVLVDPATGAMRYVSRAAFSTLPAWVSRVYPADLALQYNTWFGAYVHGLINYLAVRRDVHVPARGEVFGLLAGNQFVWFVDHTSPANDQSMTGFTYMDTVTGKMVYTLRPGASSTHVVPKMRSPPTRSSGRESSIQRSPSCTTSSSATRGSCRSSPKRGSIRRWPSYRRRTDTSWSARVRIPRRRPMRSRSRQRCCISVPRRRGRSRAPRPPEDAPSLERSIA